MADYTISTSQEGVYEISLAANTIVTIAIDNGIASPGNEMQVLVHSGASPVYANFGTTVAVKDQTATIVLAGQWVDLFSNPNTGTYTVALISSAAAVVSVYRSNR